MEFLNSFNIWDIIWFCSLIIWIIGLFLVKPIYKHFNSVKIENHIKKSNLKIVSIISWNNVFNGTIIKNVTINGETINLDDKWMING